MDSSSHQDNSGATSIDRDFPVMAKSPKDDKLLLRKEPSVPENLHTIFAKDGDLPDLPTAISTGLKLPRLSPDAMERVFPIRSIVSFDSNPSSALQTPSIERNSSFGEEYWSYPSSEWGSGSQLMMPSPPAEKSDDPEEKPIPESKEGISATDASDKSALEMSWDGISSTNSDGLPDEQDFSLKYSSKHTSTQTIRLTQRLAELVKAQDNRNYIRPPGPENDPTKNAEQSYGVLIVLKGLEGNLSVQVTSNNTKEILGYSPQELFSLESFCDILGHYRRNNFISHARLVKEQWYDVEHHGPEVFTLSVYTPNGFIHDYWCTMHTTRENENYIFCELEPLKGSIDRPGYFGHPSPNGSMYEAASTGLKTKSDFPSGPLGTLRMLKDNESDSGTYALNAMSRITQLTANAQSMEMLLNGVIGIVKQLTGFNRVTIYRLDSDWNGISMADTMDPKTSIGPYDGMRILGSIFSEDCRKLHLHNKVFLSYKKPPVELAYRPGTDSSIPLDTTHCYLVQRKSPETLTDIPVQAYMSISIIVFGKLWGLIYCQSYDKESRLSPLTQKLCWLISESISSNIERLSHILPSQIEQQTKSPQANITGCDEAATRTTKDILSLFDADYAATFTLGETKILGKPLDSQEVLALVEYLKMKEFDTIFWSTDIQKDFQDLYPLGFRFISCLLYVPLAAKPRDFIVFLKTSQWKEITWVGYNEGVPRELKGFSQTSSQDKGNFSFKPDGWSAADLGKASALSLMYRAFSEVWQQKEATMRNTQLTKLLLANCAHEVRTPLNAIINYLEIALDGPLNQETRESLSRSHSASKSLVYIINDLLDLTNAENGKCLIGDEAFDLAETIREAASIFQEEVRQKKIDLFVVQHSSHPIVLGDQRRMRQVITNLISNAIQHTSSGAVTVECSVLPDQSVLDRIAVEVAVHDTGCGMSQDKVGILFYELEQVSNEEYLHDSQCCQISRDSDSEQFKTVLGLGLALVARMVRTMDGLLSVKSEKGTGSCFKIRLNFDLPPDQSRSLDTGDPGLYQAEILHHQDGRTQDRPITGENHEDNIESKGSRDDSDINGQARGIEHNTEGVSRIVQREGSGTEILSGPANDDLDARKQTAAQETVNTKLSEMAGNEEYSGENEETNHKLHILVAEDDPINSKIVKKRLGKLGYTVHMTTNGKDCALIYRESPEDFGAVLMDLQMPIVDGSSSAKMIREAEAKTKTSGNSRIPIFAVSASLLEKDRQIYIESGFDGWIMKPIDFGRLDYLLQGVQQDELRNASVYEPGMWEKGGWFEKMKR